MLRSLGFLLLACLALAPLWAQEHQHSPSCQHQHQCMAQARSLWAGQGAPALNSNRRSDTIDILHYSIFLQNVDLNARSIQAQCEIRFRTQLPGVQSMSLDLLRLTVDSVVYQGQNLSFQYNDTLLRVTFPAALNLGDTASVRVHYRGQPQRDASWGGFYFDNGYAYNLGVGFSADPHNFGRVWYPCFDNFAERATYSFRVHTSTNLRAHCNGLMSLDTIVGSQRQRQWELTVPIPTYLSCVAISNYATVRQQINGSQGPIPVELVAQANDTINMKASFINLPSALSAMEYWFGPHRWPKIGYSAVPFSSGAMEHATNIAYPRLTLNGNTQYETLMAHELAHSWWGNWATCETSEDMWINEGMARYCEHLFIEHRYGWPTYIEQVKENHYDVLLNAHGAEGGYRAISGVPHQYTYGRHVYDKGGSVAHNLRWYLGDSLFRLGMSRVLDSFALRTINSTELRDALSQFTGQNMQPFFDAWVFNGGFPHFEVDSFATTAVSGSFTARVGVKQRLVGTTILHQQVPLQFTFVGPQGQLHRQRLMVSGSQTQIVVPNLPFEPQTVLLNEEHRLNQARIDQHLRTATANTYNTVGVRLNNFQFTQISDTAYLQLEYHPLAPDPSRNPNGYELSSTRYWSVNGYLPPNTLGRFRIEPEQTGLDIDLMQYSGYDSLLVLYRPNPNSPWTEHPDYDKVVLGSFGYLRINTLLLGDYCLAKGVMGLGIGRQSNLIQKTNAYPNPARQSITIEWQLRQRAALSIEIYDAAGRQMQAWPQLTYTSGKHQVQCNVQDWPSGMYFVKFRHASKGQLETLRFVVP